jgi:hypothetical protein
MSLTLPAFIARWQVACGPERGNKEILLHELAPALGRPTPDSASASSECCFEKRGPKYSPEGRVLHLGAARAPGQVGRALMNMRVPRNTDSPLDGDFSRHESSSEVGV